MRRNNVTVTRLIRIGNGVGVRLPKDWLKQLRVGNEVEASRLGDQLIIRPAGYHPRQGWEKALRAAAEDGDDVALDEWPPTEWDLTEWQW